MIESAVHLTKARRSILSGRHLLVGGFAEEAGRDAYMAAFQAALAYIVAATGKEPKTHRGTHTEFARLQFVRDDIPHDFVAFVSRSYEFKDVVDYQAGRIISGDEAASALDMAQRIIDTVETLLSARSAS